MILSKEEVINYIPHRDPFIMVGNLLKAEGNKIITDFYIDENNILCQKGSFSFPGLIENIAQTCAAGLGFLSKEKGEETNGGFIGSVSKLKAHKKPAYGKTIKTEVEVVAQLENIIMIKGANYSEDELLLECEMKIVVV